MYKKILIVVILIILGIIVYEYNKFKELDFDREIKAYKYYINDKRNFIGEKKLKEADEKIIFNISRYYSVQSNQSKYYLGRSYEEDYRMNCGGNCEYTADGHHLIDSERGKIVACPREYELGTKFNIEGIGEVICHDRGGKIIKQGEKVRLDIWMGLGEKGLNRIYNNSIRGGDYVGTIIN